MQKTTNKIYLFDYLSTLAELTANWQMVRHAVVRTTKQKFIR